MSVSTFFVGILMLASGVVMLKYNYQITNNFGSFGSLSRFLGPGREYAFFKLLAVLLIILGFITTFGFSDDLTSFLFKPLQSLTGGE